MKKSLNQTWFKLFIIYFSGWHIPALGQLPHPQEQPIDFPLFFFFIMLVIIATTIAIITILTMIVPRLFIIKFILSHPDCFNLFLVYRL